MSGIFLRHSSIGMVILVHYGHARCRKRFSYAHEYAHALLDRKTTIAIVSRRENSLDFIERRANAFAAAFLMPADGVRWFLEEVLDKGGPSRRYRVTYSSAGGEPAEAEERPAPGSQQITYQDVATLAHHFGVSYPAAVYRLSDLNFLNADEKASMLEKVGARWPPAPGDGRLRWMRGRGGQPAGAEARSGTRQPNRPARHRGLPARGGFSGLAP